MKRSAVLAVLLLALSSASAQAQVKSGVSNPKVTTKQIQGNQYQVTFTGTMSLAQGDVWKSYSFGITDPKGGHYTPTITFTPPAPGGSSDFTVVYYVSAIPGDWNCTATMNYLAGGNVPSVNSAGVTFTVP